VHPVFGKTNYGGLKHNSLYLGLVLPSGANVIKLFSAIIYHHSMVILSFCVINLYEPENYRGMVVNYHGILALEKVG
jgi:hypothetical protein